MKRSRYTLQAKQSDGVFLANTSSGKGGFYPLEALSLLKGGAGNVNLREKLEADGHLINLEIDELSEAHQNQLSYFFRNDVLHLIIMPTEECNFRCVYCYEKFEHGTMRPEIRQGIKSLLKKRAPQLKQLSISWFGGEPLLASDVVLELSRHFQELSKQHGFGYTAHATTNGYFLTPDLVETYLDLGLRDFQITLDGSAEFHDAKRKLADGGGTFEKIWSNLCHMKTLERDFKVALRVNLDQENQPFAEAFVRMLGRTFGNDSRFSLHLHKVGKWGGANDENLPVFEDSQNPLLELYQEGKACGLQPELGNLKPLGLTCYAALPYSFLIRSDGRLNKCTIALDDPLNQVGQLLPDGTMQIDQHKFRSWVMDNALNDTGCQSCSLRPSCQGAACPLIRLKTGERPCPDIKKEFKSFLPMMFDELPQIEVMV
jgi:uncharacterized protein